MATRESTTMENCRQQGPGESGKLRIELGRTSLSVEEAAGLDVGGVFELASPVDAGVEVRLDDRLIARGHAVVVEDNLGVRIAEICPPPAHGQRGQQ